MTSGFSRRAWAKEGSDPFEALGPVLVVAAHPDDETIGAGGLLGSLATRGLPFAVLHATDGAPFDARLRPTLATRSREEAASVRRDELTRALRELGVDVPERALLPAPDIPDQEAAPNAARLARRIAHWIEARRFEVVVTHPYEGGHPDHDAVAFACHAAVALARLRGFDAALVEMTSYHRGEAPSAEALATGVFLSGCSTRRCGHEWVLELDPGERARKRRMLDAFASQKAVLAPFGVDRERFRCAPPYDFARPPHAPPLHYELQPFGWSGEAVCARLRSAALALGLGDHTRA